ncbi:MAG: restriction endonuclease subunit S [Shewanella sp.]
MSWPMIKLGEIVQNCNAKRIPLKQSERLNRQGCYDYYGASGVIDHVDDYLFDGDYLLIGEDGNNLISRSSPIAFHAKGKFWVNNHAHILAFNGKADLGFLAYYINSINLEPYVTGSAQPKLNKKNLDSILIPLPPLDEQKRIAAILDKADAIRQKRKQAIALADEFLRSVFLDMFGDPVTNPKGWEVKNLSDIATIQIGPFGSQLHKGDYVSGGMPLINPTHIVNGKICPDHDLTVSEDKYLELPQYHLKVGDIVMGRRGEMGRCALVTRKEVGWFCGTGSLFIRPKTEQMLSEYMTRLLSSSAVKRYLESESLGATMSNLNKKIVGNIKVPIPSNDVLQQYFDIETKYLSESEKSQDFTKSDLFDSLSQKAFSGQL